MEFFKPVPVTDSVLITSGGSLEMGDGLEMLDPLELFDSLTTNVPEPEVLPGWSSVTDYSVGALVYYTNLPTYKIFRSLVTPNINNNPYTSYGFWKEEEVTEGGIAEWSAPTFYAVGQCAYVKGSAHKIFESVQPANLNHHPLSLETGWWIERGSTNLFKMFDASVGTYTRYAGDMDLWFDLTTCPGVNTLTLLGAINAESITVSIYNTAQDTVLWTETKDLIEWDTSLPVDWYWWFFSDAIPKDSIVFKNIGVYSSGTKMRVQIAKSDAFPDLLVGTLAFGVLRVIGDTQWNATVGIMDFSKKERDEFGVMSVVERSYAKTLDCDCFFENSQVPTVVRELEAVRATPCVWIGSDISMFSPTIVYGFYKSFNVVLESAGGSFCNLEIEGLV
jgi:hypothetical protein